MVLLSRTIIAIAFVLSAGWKISHQSEFRVSYRQLVPEGLARLDREAARALPIVELIIAAGLVSQGWMGRASAGAALLLIVMFTIVLARHRDSSIGCGCWRSPVRGSASGAYLLRNGTLILLSAVGTFEVAHPSPAEFLFLLAAGSLLAVILMEIPQIAVVAFAERPERIDQVQ